MIEPIIYFVIGLLFAGLIVWAIVPFVLGRLRAEFATVIDRLQIEHNFLTAEVDALRSRVGGSQEAAPTKPPEAKSGPSFLPLDPIEREQFPTIEHNKK